MTDLNQLIATHQHMLNEAVAATHARAYWSAFPESPSTKIWGDDAPAAGKAAFDALLGTEFPITTQGAHTRVAPERSPYGISLDVSYPHLTTDGVDALLAAAANAMPKWRDAGPTARAAVCVEILQRLNARSFELAHAVMHTTGQSFVMAFQAGGAHALDRGLEAVAYTYDAMTAVPTTVTWEKPQGRREPQRLAKSFVITPRGVALLIGCTTFPTWNGFPGLFASLCAGNPVIVKPHPQAVMPLAIAASTARDVLRECGFDENLVSLATELPGEGLASVLAVRPEVRIIDFTGSSPYGNWLEANAPQALVFTEKSGVNAVVFDSTDDIAGMAANLAYSLALYSGQMCTAPQVLLVPSSEVASFVHALTSALESLLGEPARALAVLGSLVDDRVASRLATAVNIGTVVVASKSVPHNDFPAARAQTPLVLRVKPSDIDAFGSECFGPVSFVVETRDTAESLELWHTLTTTRGALTASVYSTDPGVIAAATKVAVESGVSLSTNLTADVYVNQSSAFSDFHATGANPAANASLTDAAFVSGRFRVVEVRRPA